MVMLGILLALQVNNWNQKRLNRNESVEYHQRMCDDLDMVIAFLEDVSGFSEMVHEGIFDAVDILESGAKNDLAIDKMEFALTNFYRLSRHLPEFTSYNEMRSTGKLDFIYSADLRKEIEDYVIFRKLVSTAYEDLNAKVNQSGFLDPYVKYGREGGFSNVDIEFDFDALSRDQIAINTLSRYAFHWKTKSAFSKNLAESAKKLRVLVNQELSK